MMVDSKELDIQGEGELMIMPHVYLLCWAW